MIVDVAEKVAWLKPVPVHQDEALCIETAAQRKQSIVVRMRPTEHRINLHPPHCGWKLMAIAAVEQDRRIAFYQKREFVVSALTVS